MVWRIQWHSWRLDANVSSVNIKDNWDAMGRKFIEDYAAAFDGRYPELDVSVRTPWAESPTYTKEYYDANVNRSWEFTDFWNSEVIPDNAETCSDGLWIYQIADTGGGVPEYKDRTLNVSVKGSLCSECCANIFSTFQILPAPCEVLLLLPLLTRPISPFQLVRFHIRV